MRDFKYVGILGLLLTAAIIVVPIALVLADDTPKKADPWDGVPKDKPATDHSHLLNGPYATGSDVTRACLECHADAAGQVMATNHWTWQAPPVEVDWRDEPVSVGKANLLNNFCIGITSNWTGCTRCHAGYGWQDDTFFQTATEAEVDCLICHDQSGAYTKDMYGYPSEDSDLVAAAQSVALPTRENCGGCHFNGGGGNAVKHGDLDESLYYPTDHTDVHMGALDLACIDCHTSADHVIKGRSISVSVDDANQVYCTDCHAAVPHDDARINDHLAAVACQTCHIPAGAVREPTKMVWDWSTAGQDRGEDLHEYLKIKGSFIYEGNFTPDYAWFSGTAQRYLMGDPLDADGITVLNPPEGDITDSRAQIWPFKIHQAKQIYDAQFNYLIQPKTAGEDGYWEDFDWDQAARLGMEAAGLPYSGEYDFAATEMYWPLSHMVAPAEHALQCYDCHGENGRMDWEALGYHGDPMRWGGRSTETVE